MLLKFVLFTMIAMGAYGVAIILVRRLADTARQLADLRQELRVNDERLRLQLDRVEALTNTEPANPRAD